MSNEYDKIGKISGPLIEKLVETEDAKEDLRGIGQLLIKWGQALAGNPTVFYEKKQFADLQEKSEKYIDVSKLKEIIERIQYLDKEIKGLKEKLHSFGYDIEAGRYKRG